MKKKRKRKPYGRRPGTDSNSSDAMVRLLIDETPLSLAELVKEIPPKKRPHVGALYRWATRGVKGVKLETVRIGGRILSSREALARFLKATQEID